MKAELKIRRSRSGSGCLRGPDCLSRGAARLGILFNPGCGSFRVLPVASRIHQIAQFLARLEVRNLLCRNFNLGAGFWIAPNPRIALTDAETAKAANLDFVTGFQRADHGIEDGLDDGLGDAQRQIAQLGHFLNKDGIRHGGGCSDLG